MFITQERRYLGVRFVRLDVRRGVVACGVGAVVWCSEDETRGGEIVGVDEWMSRCRSNGWKLVVTRS